MAPSVKDYSYYKKRRFDPIIWFLFILCIKGIVFIFDKLLYFCTNRSVLKGSKKEQEMSKEYEHSAHIMTIYSRATISLFGNHDETNFLCLHDQYVHPNYILENDHVMLMGVDDKRAYFCISDEKVDPYHSSVGPFLWANTFIAIKKILILDINHFHRLAKVRGDPFEKGQLDITIIHMTSRCGSTLLGQILERVPRTRVMSEPKPFSYIGNMYLTGKISYVEYQHLLDSTFRIQCKKEKGIDKIIMKWGPTAMSTIPFLKEKYPDLKLVFNTRNLKETYGSIKKVFDSILPVSMLIVTAFNMTFFAHEHIPIHYDDIKWWKIYRKNRLCFDEDVERAKFLFFNWWGAIELYRKMKHKYVATVIFEDLVIDPKKEIENLFDALKISKEHLNCSLEALKIDSQQGMFGKRGSLATKDQSESLDKLDSLFKQFDVPFSSEGTLEQLKNLLQ